MILLIGSIVSVGIVVKLKEKIVLVQICLQRYSKTKGFKR